jgi:hypothetical protein
MENFALTCQSEEIVRGDDRLMELSCCCQYFLIQRPQSLYEFRNCFDIWVHTAGEINQPFLLNQVAFQAFKLFLNLGMSEPIGQYLLSQAMCPGNQGSVLGMVIGTRSEG